MDNLEIQISVDPSQAVEGLQKVADSLKQLASDAISSSATAEAAISELESTANKPTPTPGAGGAATITGEGLTSGLSGAGAGASELLTQLGAIETEASAVSESFTA